MWLINFDCFFDASNYFFNPLGTYELRVKNFFYKNPNSHLNKDYKALKTDWETVGRDFRKVINTKKEKKKFPPPKDD